MEVSVEAEAEEAEATFNLLINFTMETIPLNVVGTNMRQLAARLLLASIFDPLAEGVV